MACAWQTREGFSSKCFHLGDNKEVFDAEAFAIYQSLRTFEARQQSGVEYTTFSDCQPAIWRATEGRARATSSRLLTMSD